jgi:hypothetical protein
MGSLSCQAGFGFYPGGNGEVEGLSDRKETGLCSSQKAHSGFSEANGLDVAKAGVAATMKWLFKHLRTEITVAGTEGRSGDDGRGGWDREGWSRQDF